MPTCPRCKGTDLTHDSARGDTVCTNCGFVVEENSIVAEIEFVGNANGTSAVVGQHMNVAGACDMVRVGGSVRRRGGCVRPE